MWRFYCNVTILRWRILRRFLVSWNFAKFIHAFVCMICYVRFGTRGKCIQIEIYDGDNKNANENSRHTNAKHQKVSSRSTRASFGKSSSNSRMSRSKKKKRRGIIKRGKIIHLRLTWPNSNVVTVCHATYKVNGISRINVNNIGTAQILWCTRCLTRSRKVLFRGILWFSGQKMRSHE